MGDILADVEILAHVWHAILNLGADGCHGPCGLLAATFAVTTSNGCGVRPETNALGRVLRCIRLLRPATSNVAAPAVRPAPTCKSWVYDDIAHTCATRSVATGSVSASPNLYFGLPPAPAAAG